MCELLMNTLYCNIILCDLENFKNEATYARAGVLKHIKRSVFCSTSYILKQHTGNYVGPRVICVFLLLYPEGAEVGSRRGPSGCLVEGSIRTLKNYFKSTCRA